MVPCSRHQIVVYAAVVALVGCGDNEPPREPYPDPIPDTSSSVPSVLDEPAPTASASAAAPSDVTGVWESTYDAKKGLVGMPVGVPDPLRKADDGRSYTGSGTVTITVAASGDVTGKSYGALGLASVRGKIDGKMLRTSFVPDDALAPGAMTGVLIGIIKGDTIECELRVAGPDATAVRQANFELKKKPLAASGASSGAASVSATTLPTAPSSK
ncbi:MAG: hypothetical protein IPK82_09040 [Polyangiaceae bacterium]|nr:hypothetical protein [Polyangiaceae bacterium]